MVVTGGCLSACPAGPQSFAQETLRTLCLAYKKVDEDAYKDWHQRHQEASILLQNRAHALHQLYEEMEQNLQVGALWGGGSQHPSSSPAGPRRPTPARVAGSLLSPLSASPPAAGSHSHRRQAPGWCPRNHPVS